jgi:phosphate transport system permease protein
MSAQDVHPSVQAELGLLPSGRLKRRLAKDRALRWGLPLAFVAVVFPILDLIYWISSRALPTLTWTTLSTNPLGDAGGLYAPITGTFYLLGIATAISAGLGILAGAYTAEYATPRVANAARLVANVLTGTPSIVVGYFGYFALVLYLHSGYTLWAGAVALSVFMLPYIFRITDLAFGTVPEAQREAALGMGASRRQYLLRNAFPIAFPQVLTGIFLAMAIGAGETAPLLLTAGWSITPAQSLNQQTSYLTGFVWTYFDQPATAGTLVTLSFQAAFLLIVGVLILNLIVQIVSEIYRRRLRGLFA